MYFLRKFPFTLDTIWGLWSDNFSLLRYQATTKSCDKDNNFEIIGFCDTQIPCGDYRPHFRYKFTSISRLANHSFIKLNSMLFIEGFKSLSKYLNALRKN